MELGGRAGGRCDLPRPKLGLESTLVEGVDDFHLSTGPPQRAGLLFDEQRVTADLIIMSCEAQIVQSDEAIAARIKPFVYLWEERRTIVKGHEVDLKIDEGHGSLGEQ